MKFKNVFILLLIAIVLPLMGNTSCFFMPIPMPEGEGEMQTEGMPAEGEAQEGEAQEGEEPASPGSGVKLHFYFRNISFFEQGQCTKTIFFFA